MYCERLDHNGIRRLKLLFDSLEFLEKRMSDGAVQIVRFDNDNEVYRKAFRDLNVEWISKFFVMEEADYKALDYPQENIIDKGGVILIALLDGVPVGTCALKPMADYCFELAKMAVSPLAQGRGIGKTLMETAIQQARDFGARRMFIESNTVLATAIALYKKYGFVEIDGGQSPYERCNIQLELLL